MLLDPPRPLSRVAWTLLACGALAAGCGDDPKDEPTPTSDAGQDADLSPDLPTDAGDDASPDADVGQDDADADVGQDADADAGDDADAPDDAPDDADADEPVVYPSPPTLEQGWEARGEYIIFSSPRSVDFEGDGVKEVVTGHGVEFVTQELGGAGYVSARDGRTGVERWAAEGTNDLVGSACFVELDGDGVPDVVIGGRIASMMAVSGASGEVLWRFYPDGGAREDGWYNFYTARPVDDVDNDGVDDILAANGGDATKPPDDPVRPSGHLMILSGADGSVLRAAPMPDGAETYMSPLLFQPREGAAWMVVFGSGGETLPGSLYAAPLSDVLDEDLSGARVLVESLGQKGFFAPPSLADLDGDGGLDVVAPSFDGRLVAVNPTTGRELWSLTFEGTESYTSPALGLLNEDEVPDVFVTFSVGEFPFYTETIYSAVDGATGELLWQGRDPRPNPSSPLAVDFDGDGRDELLWTASDLLTGADRGLVFLDLQDEEPEMVEVDRAPGGTIGTPLVDDLDGDGFLELVTFTYEDFVVTEPENPDSKWIMTHRRLSSPTPRKISWGAYLGTDYDGVWRPAPLE